MPPSPRGRGLSWVRATGHSLPGARVHTCLDVLCAACVVLAHAWTCVALFAGSWSVTACSGGHSQDGPHPARLFTPVPTWEGQESSPPHGLGAPPEPGLACYGRPVPST